MTYPIDDADLLGLRPVTSEAARIASLERAYAMAADDRDRRAAEVRAIEAERDALHDALRMLVNAWPGIAHFEIVNAARALLDGGQRARAALGATK